jgi:hypothetical protein
MRTALVLAASLAIAASGGCSTPSRNDKAGGTAGGSTTTPGPTTPPPDRSPGMTTTDSTSQALTPRADLIAWLDANGGKPDLGTAPVLRLPVTLTWGDQRISITGATLGEVAVKLDDSALGISLKDRARNKCPADQPTCRVLIEGRWRGLDGDTGTIQVTRFVSALAADQAGDRVELVQAP